MVDVAPFIQSNSGSEIPIPQKKQTFKTLKVFKQVYESPPRVNINLKPLKTLKDNEFTLITQKRDSLRLPSMKVPYLAGKFQSNESENYTSNFYTKQTSTLKKALQHVPIYVVVNSNNELIFTQPYGDVKVGTKPTKYRLLNSVKKISSTNEGNNIFFFLNKEDANSYLKEIQAISATDNSGVGVALHCVGLDVAYDLMRHARSNFDFKFVPDLQELKSFLGTKSDNLNFIFDKQQQQTYYKARAIKGPNNVGYLPGISLIQNNEYFKGVPIYIIQYRNASPMSAEKFLNYFVTKYLYPLKFGVQLSDEIAGRITNFYANLFGCGKVSTLQGEIKLASTSSDITNYIFFSSEQALKFLEEYETLCKENKRIRNAPNLGIVPYPAARVYDNLAPLINRPRIFVTNLEDFVEQWEETLLQRQVDLQNGFNDQSLATIFSTKETIFVPTLSSTPNSQIEMSTLGQFKQNIASKMYKVKAFLRSYSEA